MAPHQRLAPHRGEPSRRPVRLRVEPLEPRLLLSAAYPSNYDQYLLELINRARADPAAEAARYGISLNEGLPPGTISADPKQPLATNPYLLDGARGHTQWMINTDTFSHTGSGGSDPGDRMAAAGYSFVPSWGWGENIAMVQSTGALPMAATTAELHENLFVDSDVAGRGHRLNLMDPDFREAGTAVLAGDWDGWNAVVCTEDFAYSGSGVLLTGVAYNDGAVQNDDFYTPGEGLSGISIVATRVSDGAEFTASTWSSGGYTLALAAGTYNVTASGGGLGGQVVFNNVVIGSQNVKRDFTPDLVAAAPDLRVTALSAPDAAVGDTVSVPTTVTNSGNAATGAGFVVSYYLSDDTAWDAGDTLLAATGNSRSALAAGGTDSFTAQVTLPPGVSGGKYVVAYVDWDGAAGAIAESNETNNNTTSDPLTILVPAPDLRVTSLSAPDAAVGDTISVPTAAMNSGNAATGAGFVVSYYLSDDAAWDAGDTLLGATGNSRPALAAGGTDSFTAQVALPLGVSGSKYVVAYVDWDGAAGAIAESNEANNNTASDPLTIRASVLLLPPWPADPSAVVVGQPFAFDFASTPEGQPGAAYSLVAGPSWLTMDAATGLLAGTPVRRADIASGPVTVRVDDGQGTTEDLTFQLAVQGQVIALGAALAEPLTKATFTDTTGDLVTASVKGQGTVYLVRGVAPGPGGVYSNTTRGDLVAIEAAGTDAKSAIALAAKAAVKGVVPRTAVRDIVVNGSLGSLSGPAADLLGDLTVTGGLGKLTLGDVAAQHALSIGSDPLIASATIVLGRVADATLTSATPLKSLSVLDWLDAEGPADTIAAPWIASLTTRGQKANLKKSIAGIAGDFGAGLTLSGLGAAKATLGKAAIAGSVAGGRWDVAGSLGSVAVRGNFTNCTIEAGLLASISVAGRITEDGSDGDADVLHALLGGFSARDLTWSGPIPPEHLFGGLRAFAG